MSTYTVAPQLDPALKARQIDALTTSPGASFSISPVIHPADGVADPRSRTFWSATANALYIVRRDGQDLFGPTPSLADKLAAGNDLVDHGRRGPIGCDADVIAGLRLWEAADSAAREDRPSAPVAYHAVGSLPENCTQAAWRELTLGVPRSPSRGERHDCRLGNPRACRRQRPLDQAPPTCTWC